MRTSSFYFAVVLMACASAMRMKLQEEVKALQQQFEVMKKLHLTDITRLNTEMEDVKRNCVSSNVISPDTNGNTGTAEWLKTSINDLHVEMREINKRINGSNLLHQLHNIRIQVKKSAAKTASSLHLKKMMEMKISNLNDEIASMKMEREQLRNSMVLMRSHISKIGKELRTQQMKELFGKHSDKLLKEDEIANEVAHAHKMRHNRIFHNQILRLSRNQDQLDAYQQNLQKQISEVQQRLEHFQESKWNLLSTKVNYLEMENINLRNELQNTTQKVSDFDKVHASMLELREEIESIENKADNTIPEIRKEVSKLDISYAQLNTQASYMKEDQENLRQSVKAIAVSVSNMMDREGMNRLIIKKLNESITELQIISKNHFHRLNDHILKSEANNIVNQSNNISLPELIGAVKELEPVQHEYESLVSHLPKDCSHIKGPPGSYMIKPGRNPLDAWCVHGGTLLQRRFNGSVDFNRKYIDYVNGFGSTDTEYWIGLSAMNLLTADNCSKMSIFMTDIYGGKWLANYDHFNVGNADNGYNLEVSGFTGNASDAFEYHNHMEFSALDRDRDISNAHCAANYEGGWWFSHCQHVNINGRYALGLTWFNSNKNEWIAVASSEMYLFRNKDCV